MKPPAETFANLIIREASRFTGLREVRPNADWDDPRTPGPDKALADDLRAMMRDAPWEEGWAYCAAFCEGVVVRALERLGLDASRFEDAMSPHVMTAVARFRKRGLLADVPEPGAIWLARHGESDRGHAGIVTAVRGVSLATVEANTSLDSRDPAKDREGDWITHRLFMAKGRGSLRTQGFICPASILQMVSSS